MAKKADDEYKIVCSQKNLDLLSQWATKAAQLGIRDRYVNTLETILQQLTTHPLTWGDPQYRLKRMDLVMGHGIHEKFQVFFGVDEVNKIVYVKEFRVLAGHPLADDI